MFFFSTFFYFVCLVHHPTPAARQPGGRGSGEYLTSHCTLPAAAAAPAPLSFWDVCFIAALNKGKERAAGWIRAQLPRAELCALIVRINVGGGLSLAGSFLLLPRFCKFLLGVSALCPRCSGQRGEGQRPASSWRATRWLHGVAPQPAAPPGPKTPSLTS